MKRTLSLKSETLAELSTADLARVAGAAGDPSIGSCPVLKCVTEITDVLSGDCYTYNCPSIEAC